jgi:hypothetical protein
MQTVEHLVWTVNRPSLAPARDVQLVLREGLRIYLVSDHRLSNRNRIVVSRLNARDPVRLAQANTQMPPERRRTDTLVAYLALDRHRVLNHPLKPLQPVDFRLLELASVLDLVERPA